MNELPLPIWFFLLYPLCWIVLFPALTLWSIRTFDDITGE